MKQVTRGRTSAMLNDVRSITLASFAGALALAALYVPATVPPPAAVAILGVFIVLSTWQPVVVLGLTAATLPLYHQPVEIGASTLAPSELLLAALVFGTLVGLSGAGLERHSLRAGGATSVAGLRRLNTPFGRTALGALGLLSVLALALLAGVAETDARSAGLRELRWTLVEPLLFVGLLLWHATASRARAYVLGAFVTGGLCVALWGLADAVSGGGVSAGGVTRASGLFPHPNAFALFLLRPVAFASAYLVLRNTRAEVPWLACGLGVAALVASFSRSAALGLVVGLILLWPWLSARLRVLLGVGAGTLSLALIVLAGDRAVGGSGQDSLALRADIWQAGLAMIRDRPVLGYGPDQFLYNYSPRYVDPSAWAERFTAHGHNLIVDAWVRVGIIGAVCGVLALVFIARAGRELTQASVQRGIDPLRGAAIVALVAAGAQGLVDNGYFVHDLAMSAWLLAWTAFAPPAPDHRRGAHRHESRGHWSSRAGRFPSV